MSVGKQHLLRVTDYTSSFALDYHEAVEKVPATRFLIGLGLMFRIRADFLVNGWHQRLFEKKLSTHRQ